MNAGLLRLGYFEKYEHARNSIPKQHLSEYSEKIPAYLQKHPRKMAEISHS